MASEGGAPDISDSATRLNATIGVAAFVIIFGCVGFFITLDVCLRLVMRRQSGIIPIGRTVNEHVNLLNKGLDKAVIDSLPVFIYSAAAAASGDKDRQVTDCPVCLCEFEEEERGRLLPKCNHAFHAACIDMWFQSHATCPICRSSVVDDPAPPPSATPAALVIAVEPLEGSSSSAARQPTEMAHQASSAAAAAAADESSSSVPPPHLTIDISKAAGIQEAQQDSFRSPVAATLDRLKSLRRMLSSSSFGGSGRDMQQQPETNPNV